MLDLALERTHLASERTYFAMLRTGFTIAGLGSLAAGLINRENLPPWIAALFSAIFVGIGIAVVVIGLQRYQRLAATLRTHTELEPIPVGLVRGITYALQAALVGLLALYMLHL